MTTRISLLSVCLALTLSCKVDKKMPEGFTMNQGRLESRDFYEEIPMDTSGGGAWTVPVVINGVTHRFMVDTGAPMIISEEIFREAHFPFLQQSTARDSNGDTVSLRIISVTKMELAGINFSDIPALVFDFSKPPFNCEKIDGLVGSNALRDLIIQFNKDKHKLILTDRLNDLPDLDSADAMSMIIGHEQSDAEVPIRFGSGAVDTALFDSGDNVFYTVSNNVFNRNGESDYFKKKVVAIGSGLATQGLVQSNTDNLKCYLLHLDSVFIVKALITHVFSQPNYDSRSRIGRGLFRYAVVTLDYPSKQFYFHPYHNLNYTRYQNFGFSYQERGGKFVVGSVFENTPASAAGIEPGFEITKFGNFSPASDPDKCGWSARVAREAAAIEISVSFKDESGSSHTTSLEKIDWSNR